MSFYAALHLTALPMPDAAKALARCISMDADSEADTSQYEPTKARRFAKSKSILMAISVLDAEKWTPSPDVRSKCGFAESTSTAIMNSVGMLKLADCRLASFGQYRFLWRANAEGLRILAIKDPAKRLAEIDRLKLLAPLENEQ